MSHALASAPVPVQAEAPAVDACWNRIGVRGDRSCPKLAEHIHCRNCPVFAGAARTLLDRPLPAGYVADWSSHFAEAKAPGNAETRSAVVFRLGAEWFALPTELFDEITETRRIHALPHRRNPAVLGLVNVRGELIICISLHALLGLAATPLGEAERGGMARPRLVVIRHGSGPIAFCVDEVQPTFRFDEKALKSVPATIVRASSNFTKGLLAWRERPVGYLDAERIVHAVNQSLA
jgi:chemotaxis-related protein WspD